MAAEYNKIIFMGMDKPSDKCLLVSFPMNMYRIQTRKFTSGLNFFQKAVLKLKFMPQLSNARIAQLINIDEKLVNLIVEQLEEKGLITSTGQISCDGKNARNDADGLIIESTGKQIGYVFSYDGGTQIFPFYQKTVNFADFNQTEIIFSTESGIKSLEFPLDVLNKKKSTYTAPNEEVILQIIKNTAYLESNGEGDNGQLSNEMLQIRYIPNDQPEFVSVCTYVYLPKIDDDKYEDDWQVLDPFNPINNYELKLFLEKEKKNNKELANALFLTFKDAVTENNKKFDESLVWFEQQVEDRIALLFNQSGFTRMDVNIQNAIRNVIDSYMKMERAEFKCINDSNIQMFFVNMQSALETILLQDQKDREEIYEDLNNNYGSKYTIQEDRKRCMKLVYAKKILSDNTLVPSVLFNKKTKSWTGRSLLDYLMKFIMSLSVEPNLEDCNIINVFKNRIEFIVDIASQRNQVGHGSTVSECVNAYFDKEDAQKYFTFMTELINDYIKTL